MFNIGDTVMYPGTGLCEISDITKQKFMHTEEKTYYVLKAVYDNAGTTIYCPTDNAAKMRKLITEKEVESIIGHIPVAEKLWVENDTERKKVFSALVKDGDRKTLICLISELHEKQKAKEAQGKKLHLADEKIFREAQKLISQELAYTMNVSVDEAAELLMKRLDK